MEGDSHSQCWVGILGCILDLFQGLTALNTMSSEWPYNEPLPFNMAKTPVENPCIDRKLASQGSTEFSQLSGEMSKKK